MSPALLLSGLTGSDLLARGEFPEVGTVEAAEVVDEAVADPVAETSAGPVAESEGVAGDLFGSIGDAGAGVVAAAKWAAGLAGCGTGAGGKAVPARASTRSIC